MDYQALKSRQRLERDSHPPNLALRVHRALSWLNRAEQLAEDRDGQFIFLWIAFNAAYATDLDDKYRTRATAIVSHVRRSGPMAARRHTHFAATPQRSDIEDFRRVHSHFA